MKTIVTEFRNFRYNCLPTGMCASGYIFQAKVDKLLGDIKFVKKYINDILVLSKDFSTKNIYHLIAIIFGLNNAELKSDAKISSWGLKYIPYLCYIKTKDWIKPDPNKL